MDLSVGQSLNPMNIDLSVWAGKQKSLGVKNHSSFQALK
jgi:hypothetical protein